MVGKDSYGVCDNSDLVITARDKNDFTMEMCPEIASMLSMDGGMEC